MAIPPDSDRDLKTSAPWYRKPLSVGHVLAIAGTLVTVLAFYVVWRALPGGEPFQKRWRTFTECETERYSKLTSVGLIAKCPHTESESVGELSPKWAPHVSVYATLVPAHPPTLRDLAGQGQAAAINFLEKDPNAWATLQDALGNGRGNPNLFRFDVEVASRVDQGDDWELGDRLIWTRVIIEPINFSFSPSEVVSSEYDTSVTQVEAATSTKRSADISATIPGTEEAKAGIEVGRENNVKSTSATTARYERFGVNILPSKLSIISESELAGNAVAGPPVPVAIVTDRAAIWRRFPLDQSPPPPSDNEVFLITKAYFDEDRVGDHDRAAMIDILPMVPVPHCSLRARVWLLYEVRRVTGGREYYDESKQDVTLVRDAEDRKDVEIMSADEVSPAVWSIMICQRASCSGQDENLRPLTAQFKGGAFHKVVFTDYGVATSFTRLLSAHTSADSTVGDYRFNWIPNSNDSLVLTRTTADECKTTEVRVP